MKKLFIICVLVSIFLIPFMAFAADNTGVTDKEVTIGITLPMSGPAAFWGALGLGAKAWAGHVNDQGGINGRRIKILLKDDGYNPARSMANLQAFKDKVLAVNIMVGTANANASKDFFAANKIPLIMPYVSVRIWASMPREKVRYVFATYPDYEDQGIFVANYAINQLGSKKIAVFYQNDDYGKPGLTGAEKALKASPGKAKLVGAVPYELPERALGTHALKLKESGADTVILNPTPLHGSLIIKEMAKVGYRPKLLTVFPMKDPVMFKLLGELWEGVYVTFPGMTGVPGSSPIVDKVVDILLKYEPKLKGKEASGLDGAMGMMHLLQGMKNAGSNLTRERLVQGMEQIKDWKPQGIGAPVTYGPDRHHGNNALLMGQAKGGRAVALTDWTFFKTMF
ncbi:MAG: ABC transporter substrate-binding protein [Deltaproteobacteria bacterium]|nr:ABC transporter substrate-binding protein [Deltaproteobacteria bacterium]